jgi:uncharacterized protein (DUF983 family)
MKKLQLMTALILGSLVVGLLVAFLWHANALLWGILCVAVLATYVENKAKEQKDLQTQKVRNNEKA